MPKSYKNRIHRTIINSWRIYKCKWIQDDTEEVVEEHVDEEISNEDYCDSKSDENIEEKEDIEATRKDGVEEKRV